MINELTIKQMKIVETEDKKNSVSLYRVLKGYVGW